MGIQSGLETWNSTLWNECENPIWLSGDCIEKATLAAKEAYPNEVCGLFVCIDGDTWLHVFQGNSTEWSCLADENEVISFAYWLKEHSGTVVASFHTHPHGCLHPSHRDVLLNVWANWHVLLVWNGDSWLCRVFQS